MFSKLFSSKSPSDEHSKTIRDFYQTYQSDIFPKGIAAVTELTKLSVKNSNIVLSITVPFPCLGELAIFAEQLLAKHEISVLIDAEVKMIKVKEHAIEGITNIIAISSGKGGVGKSTTAVNLAYALQEEGANVGILDADIYGPSIPKMLGLAGQRLSSIDGKKMQPLESGGLAAMSIGFLTDENDATIWRGPMASRAFGQLLNETAWSDLDYLIVDMPPGTGDIQLTLAQQVPVAAAIVITTPQDIALNDAVKGLAMFKEVKVPVLGIIENMSYHICDNCGEKSHLFGRDGGVKISTKFNCELLGQLPLDISICESADQGNSQVLENSTGEVALQYRRIATKIASGLFHQLDKRSPLTKEILIKTVD
ncbi:iron-sulfur cluster carrier protein ApbC [Thalassotalea profundi]|uniref:Iron-sulfur cluster carrier protein n=1 Tax=Thalassotalea profundi TaxID=2036687 RepID=A0ABQ3J585_9GAMM|nr:iron-sulfur cluster carrier protein ApbC [Thalassotalea profundi]GHF01246.1 iron-sulfur cluster carrier protein [Thalassotalea profundi]